MSQTLHEIRTGLENNPFLKRTGFEILKFEEEDILLKLKIEPSHLNLNQTLHGGVHASMLETAQAMAIRSLYKTRVSVINVNIQYLMATSSGDLFARAIVFQKGYKIAGAEAEIRDSENRLIAKGSGVYKIIRE
ncbi:PaaI family thioesterase [Neobacillus terrae]|uniref:PaaI family thioesterase n=1 Tax=Neobacillus terrae TaxID=3034837 RepID=UPI00140B97B2|nr:PaaI family thioesterase [Neobacillus terrae]NHM31226.1 PaaI family thioesterase [Neobacillus terrae]